MNKSAKQRKAGPLLLPYTYSGPAQGWGGKGPNRGPRLPFPSASFVLIENDNEIEDHAPDADPKSGRAAMLRL